MDNEDQSCSVYTKAEGKANVYPKKSLPTEKAIKTGRTSSVLMSSRNLSVCTAYLSVLLPLLKRHLPDHGIGDKLGQSTHFDKDCTVRALGHGCSRNQKATAILNHKKRKLWPRSTYKLLCFERSFLLIFSGLWTAHNQRLSLKLKASKAIPPWWKNVELNHIYCFDFM